jgi:hypothetical protein
LLDSKNWLHIPIVLHLHVQRNFRILQNVTEMNLDITQHFKFV